MKQLSINDLVKIKFAALVIGLLLALVGGLEGSRYFLITTPQTIVYDDYFHAPWTLQFNGSIFQRDQTNETSTEILTTLDTIYNRYTPSSDEATLYTLNHEGYGSNEWISVSPSFFEMLHGAYQWTLMTEGSFNMFVGSYVDLWFPHLLIGDGYPSEDDLATASLCVPSLAQLEAQTLLEFDEVNQRVKFNRLDTCPVDESVVITLGGYAKGFAVDILSDQYSSLDSLYINGGASSIYIGDFGEEGKTLSFYNPLVFDGTAPQDQQIGLTLTLPSNLSISTSGDYQQGYRETVNEESVWLHHIVDATTGWPSNYYRAVTVITDSSGDADALSTALMNLSLEDAYLLLDRLSATGVDVTCYFMVQVGDEIVIHSYDGGHEVTAESRFEIVS